MALVIPIFFFILSIVGKFVPRATMLKEDAQIKIAFYEIFTIGSELCLISVSILVSVALAKALIASELSVVLFCFSFIFLVVYLIIIAIETAFNDSTKASFKLDKHGIGGIYVPALTGVLSMVLVSYIICTM